MPMVQGRERAADARTIVALMIRGDGEAWDRFVGAYGPFVRQAIRARAPDEDRDEIYSQVLTRLVERDYALLRNFRWDCSLETYPSYLARSECHRVRRRWLIARARESIPGAVPEADPPQESIDRVRCAIGGLPARDRLLLRLVFFEGMRYAEAAEALGVSPNSIGPLLGRALARLKEELRP
jgi:RNA polymerase sigma-70 factor (ECF subfamily)